jgi:ferredoxin-NADP reductase
VSPSVPGWAGHRGAARGHPLTAHDDYQAERAYCIASAPGEPLAITVEWLDDGEVSPCLAEGSRTGELLEVRGPIGSYFVWEPGSGGPVAGRSAVRASC